MERLRLTIDAGTSGALARHARRAGKPRAALARELLQEAIERREALERQREVARDAAAGRDDAEVLLEDMEIAQREIMGREDA